MSLTIEAKCVCVIEEQALSQSHGHFVYQHKNPLFSPVVHHLTSKTMYYV